MGKGGPFEKREGLSGRGGLEKQRVFEKERPFSCVIGRMPEGPCNCLGDGLMTVFTKPILRATIPPKSDAARQPSGTAANHL